MRAGKLRFYVNGNQDVPVIEVGQVLFHTNLDRIRLGSFAGQGVTNGMASFEFYLRPLSQQDIIAAMARSTTFPGVNFTIILRAAFSNESLMSSFSVLTF